jgi:hypothetical protein
MGVLLLVVLLLLFISLLTQLTLYIPNHTLQIGLSLIMPFTS